MCAKNTGLMIDKLLLKITHNLICMATEVTTRDCKLPVDILIELLRHVDRIFEDGNKNRYRACCCMVCNLAGIVLLYNEPSLFFNEVQKPRSTWSYLRNNECVLPPKRCNSLQLTALRFDYHSMAANVSGVVRKE